MTPPSKHKRSSGTEGEPSTSTAEPTKAKKKKKKKERNQENGKASEVSTNSDKKAAALKSKKVPLSRFQPPLCLCCHSLFQKNFLVYKLGKERKEARFI